MFYREKQGKYIVQACTTTPCQACGAYDVLDAIKKHLKIDVGETTKDGLFTLIEVECLGACANAPMVQVNDDFYECLNRDTVVKVLEAFQAGKPIPMTKWGSRPMNGQLSCEGPLGKTTLKEKPWGPGDFMRPDSELQPKVEPKNIMKEMLYD